MKGRIWYAMVALLSLAAIGCAPLSGYPRDPNDLDAELAALQTYFSPDIRTQYDALVDANARRQFRDRVVYAQLRAYDINFKRFQKALTGDRNAFGVGTDWILLGLNAAGAATGGSAALSAASAGIVGAKGSVDKELFYQKTLPALLAAMEASRTAALVPIEQGLSKPDAEYSLHKALADVSTYDRAGSIPGAINAIVKDAGAKGNAAEAELKFARTAEFAKSLHLVLPVQARLKALTLSQALAVAKAMEPNLPKRTKEVRDFVNGLDPTGERLKSGEAAKQLLLAWQINDARDAASIKEWTDALDAAEKQ